MVTSENETLLLQQCCTLDGNTRNVTVGRRNGRPTAFFTPECISLDSEPNSDTEERRLHAIREEIAVRLNPVERRTWERLINGRSISEIALDDGVSRSAVYERIRGNSKAQGGMIAKNEYVALWWRLRRESRSAVV